MSSPRKANSSVPKLDRHYSVVTNLTIYSNSNEKEVKESKVRLYSVDNIQVTRPFTCPGCRIDFKSFFLFVLYIENRSGDVLRNAQLSRLK